MPDPDLLQQAEARQKQAYQVLNTLRLLERWQTIGKPVLVGSMRFGAMVTPNIDMEVYTDEPTASAGFAIVGQLAEIPGVKEIRYLNALDSLDQGLYWYIVFEDAAGVSWGIDVWLVAHDHPYAYVADRLATAMEKRLDAESRRRILTIKSGLPAEMKVRGVDIYKAVLRDGVATADAMLHWLQANPPEPMELWHP
jgi:hypothetical protein